MSGACVILQAAGGSYALPMAELAEVVLPGPVTRVPGLPDWVPGLTSWRGRLLAVLDLPRLLGSVEPLGAVVVVRRGELELGLACAEVTGMLDLDTSALLPAPPRATTTAAELVTGHVIVEGAVIAMIDPGNLFALRSRLPARVAA